MPRDFRHIEAGRLAPGGASLLVIGGFEIAVFNVRGSYYAIDNRCPHRQGPLWEGDVEGFLAMCPQHGWQFDVRTGACDTVPGRDVATYPVRVEDGHVIVSLPDAPDPDAD